MTTTTYSKPTWLVPPQAGAGPSARRRWRAGLLSGLLCLSLGLPARAQTTTRINYQLPTAGKVSLAVYDNSGKLVRTLLNAEARSAGTHQETWDGKDDNGQAVASPNTCTWKVLQQPGAGLQANYLTTFATTLPHGKDYWEDGVGSHVGPRSIAVDASGVYIGAGITENLCNALKMTADGSQRLWSAWQPGAFRGRYALANVNGWLYHLRQDAKVGGHPVDQPNVRYQAVGDNEESWSTGVGWDALWPRERRPPRVGTYGDAVFQAWLERQNQRWNSAGGQDMDLAGYPNGENLLVLSYLEHDTVLWRNASNGTITRSVAVPDPKGVAVDAAGNVLVLSGSTVQRIAAGTSTRTTFISGLIDPFRLDVDPVTGDIWVAEHGASQQLKRFSPQGALQVTVGAYGGRQYGLYNPANFRDVVDVTADRQGGVFVAENVSPRRIVHLDRNGARVKEWYGSAFWVPSASPDPDDPTTVWLTVSNTELQRVKINYSTNTWQLHSVYRFAGLAGGMIGTSFGGGYGDWHVRKHAGTTYLVRRGALQVLKVDETNWTLKPVVVGDFGEGVGSSKKAYLWTDADGDGQPQPGEYQRYTWGEWQWQRQSLQAPAGFDYLRYVQYGKAVVEHRITGWNSVGAPLYRPLDAGRVVGTLPGSDFNDSYYYEGPGPMTGIFARESTTSPLFVAINAMRNRAPTQADWGRAEINKMYRLDTAGTVTWRVGQHANRPNTSPAPPPPAGSIYSFKNTVGVTRGVVVATDYDGGFDGAPPGITYAWDDNGLYVGGLFANPNLATEPEWQYTHSTDNGTGQMYTDPVTGDVLFFVGTDNAARAFRISGWNNWLRLSGPVNNAGPTAGGLAVNAGGAAAGAFVADTYVSGGTVYAGFTGTVDVSGVTSPAPQAVYQSERYGVFTYTLPGLVAGQSYQVRLHFAENYWTQPGQRKFHVDINGARKLTEFDILAAAGGANKALVREFAATANASGQIQVAFLTGSANYAKINGIEVVPAAATLYRAINLNGPALTLDGNAWEASASAPNLTLAGTSAFANQAVPLVPATDTDRAQMIRSSVWGSSPSVTLDQVPAGSYDVYLYVWEDNNPQTFSVAVQGQTVQANYNSGAAGAWSRLGPFRATVGSAGTLVVSTQGGHANLSGLELWRVNNTSARSALATAGPAAPLGAALTVYPNPASRALTLSFVAAETGQAELTLTDGLGRQLQRQTLRATQGLNQVPVDVASLPNGLYSLKLVQNGKASTQKVAVSKQ